MITSPFAMRAAALALFAFIAAPTVHSAGPAAPDEIGFNDNLARAGTLDGTTLSLALEIREGTWHPLGVDKPGLRLLAFGEPGRPLQNPGPFVRVPTGTTIRATVANTTRAAIVVHGLAARDRVGTDSLLLDPGSERQVEFAAGPAGTFYYWADAPGTGFKRRHGFASQLNGAIVVDSAKAPAKPLDRVFVMETWAPDTAANGTPIVLNALFTINGRPWPLTERMHFTVGDTVRWRIVNTSLDLHPFHLHGFYYRVDAQGDSLVDTVFTKPARRMVVTEPVRSGTTMSMTWSPDRPGNWAFHCHLIGHVTPNPALGPVRPTPAERLALYVRGDPMHDGMDHATDGMGGLVLAVSVKIKKEPKPAPPVKRQLRLDVRSDSSTPGKSTRFTYELPDAAARAPGEPLPRPGALLVLHRGEPTGIRIVNRTPEATAVHWHGLELESYFDGIAGLSGSRNHLAPMIAPGDSFSVRITPPRAGTFMYHTHLDDMRQLARGLYAPLIVLEPGETFHPETDHLVVLSGDTIKAGIVDVLLNGTPSPPPLTVRAGVPQRFRVMMITVVVSSVSVGITHADTLVRWTPFAKDGYTLPASQAVAGPALRRYLAMGETFDAMVTFPTPGTYALEVRIPVAAPGNTLLTRQDLRVVP